MYSRYNDDTWLTQNVREQMIAGYSEVIQQQITNGLKPYFINFMFNHIPGRRENKMDVMAREVNRVHDILTRHIVRRPSATNWAHLRPVFIGCPDLPVWKHEKELVRNLVVNGGLHFNVVALVPEQPVPEMPEMPIPFQFRFCGRKKSRLKVPLKVHFQQSQRFYLNEFLSRIHVTAITQGTMADYTLKAFRNATIDPDRIQIWK